METLDLIYIIPSALAVISFIVLLVFHKESDRKSGLYKTLRMVPVLSVVALIVGIVYVSEYYKSELEQEKRSFENLQPVPLPLADTTVEILTDHMNDSVSHQKTDSLQQMYVDSLKAQNARLRAMLKRVKKQQQITGDKSELNDEIKDRLDSNRVKIVRMNSIHQNSE